MFNITDHVNTLVSYLKSNVKDSSAGVDVRMRFPANYISYPLVKTTLVVSCPKINCTAPGKSPVGTADLEIGVYTIRDLGSTPHQAVLDQVTLALCNFTAFSIASFRVGEIKFDRTNSALRTSIICTVNFG